MIHRDIKPSNILLDKYCKAFVADFGVAKIYDRLTLAKNPNTAVTFVGTKSWMAPEMKKAYENDFKTDMSKIDVFSLGLISLFALDFENFKKKKFRLNSSEDDIKSYLDEIEKKSQVSDIIDKKALIPDRVFLKYLKRMLEFDIKKRPSVSDVYEDIVEVGF